MPPGISAAIARHVKPLIATFVLSGTTLIGIASSQAEIIKVDYGSEDLPQLSESDQEKIDTLFGTQLPTIVSSVSPDGRTLVVATFGRINTDSFLVQFLDLRTGELIDSLALEYEVYSPELPIRWVNNDVVRFVQEGVFGPWEIVTINRKTQIVSRTTVYPTEAEEGEILGVAPDFSKFVIRVFEEEEDVVYMVFLPSLDRIEVARLPEGFEIQPPSWSEDGDQVVLVTSSTEERSLYDRTPFSPSFADPVTQDALGRMVPEDNVFRDRNEVKVFDFNQKEPLKYELKASEDEVGSLFANAAISPDGSTVMVKMYNPAQVEGRENPSYLFPQSAYYRFYDLEGNLTATVDDPALSGPLESQGDFVDDDTALFTATVGTNRQFFVYELVDQSLRSLPLPPGSVDLSDWEVTPDGQTLIYGFSSVTQPPELFTLPLDGSAPPTQLTDINADVATANQVRVDAVTFPTHDGDRSGFLVQPAGAAFPPQDEPIVFWQQGGPGFSMANEFAVEVEMPLNLLPNFGIPVLVVPLAGREGFGEEFYRLQADNDNFGQIDILEGADIVGDLVSQGWTTRQQIGVTGCSYGGYYTSQAIARFPGLFAAANPQCSLLDTFTEWQLGYSSLLSYLVGKTPMEAPEHYQYLSPLYNADQITTPTMLFHGSDDFLQIDVARNFHDVIDAQGTPVTLYEFQGVGHSIYDPEFQRIAAQLQIDFFRKYLTQP